MNNFLLAILLSMSPISELRGGIPFILSVSEFNLSNSIMLPLVCIIANMLVVLLVFFFLDFLHHRLVHFRYYKKIFDFFVLRIQKKARKLKPQIDAYGYLALAVFVAVPLPMTGAWTGALISWLLDLDRKKSFFAIALGVFAAGIIVTAITLASMGILRIFS
ncbi:MAG: small multi-drug export protein [archaeon]